jgi:hypothetical protein
VGLIKGLIAATTVATAASVYWSLGTIRPQHRTPGAVAVLWNPMLVILLAGEGHNDALVMLLVVSALGLSVRRAVIGGSLVQLVAVFTKYVPLVLLPVQAAYWWRSAPNRRELVAHLAIAGALGLGVGVALFAPVWLGVSTFVGTGALGSGEPTEMRYDVWGTVFLAGRSAVVVAAVLIGAWRARSGTRLSEACAGVVLVALLVGPQKFWPWYAVLPVALMARTPGAAFRWMTLVLSGCVLLASPIEALPMSGQGLIGFDAQIFVFRATRVVPLLGLIMVWAAQLHWTPVWPVLMRGRAR